MTLLLFNINDVNTLLKLGLPLFLSCFGTRHFYFRHKRPVWDSCAVSVITSIRVIFETTFLHSASWNLNEVMNSQFSWSEWFSEWWGSESAPIDFTKSQLSLDDGWGIIESEADRVFAEESRNAADFRRQEVEKLNEMARQNASSISKYNRLFGSDSQIGGEFLPTLLRYNFGTWKINEEGTNPG
jgi:hypothetical protein